MEISRKEMGAKNEKAGRGRSKVNNIEKKVLNNFFNLPPIVPLVIILLGPVLLMMNPFAIVMLTLFIPILLLKMKNKIIRDLILMIPLFIYFDIWALVFLGLTLAGYLFEGIIKKYFNLGIYSIIFSLVALFFAFEGHFGEISKVVSMYDWRTAVNESDQIMLFSILIYFVVYVLMTMAKNNFKVGNDVKRARIENKTNENSSIKDNEKLEKIDPNKASFKQKNEIRMEEWIRKDRSDS